MAQDNTHHTSRPRRCSTAIPETPLSVLAAGSLVLMLSIGTKHIFGLFLEPLSEAHGWGREVFGMAIAVQNIVWGATQPFVGYLADRHGAGYLVAIGSLLVAAGVGLVPYSTQPWMLYLSLGVAFGLGLSGTAFPVIFGAISRSLPGCPSRQSMALGLASSLTSTAVCILFPTVQYINDHYSPTLTLRALSLACLLCSLPCGLLLLETKALGRIRQQQQQPPSPDAESSDTLTTTTTIVSPAAPKATSSSSPSDDSATTTTAAMRSSITTTGPDQQHQHLLPPPPASPPSPPSSSSPLATWLWEGTSPALWLLSLSFFVCGFHVVFIATHLPAFVVDQGLSPYVAVLALTILGLFDVAGPYLAGWLGAHYSRSRLLTGLYLLRAVAMAAYVWGPKVTPVTTYFFAAVMGVVWLSNLPLTNGILVSVYGESQMSLLSGVTFFFHQVGSFLGGWLGGYIYDAYGTYMPAWTICVAGSVVAAVLSSLAEEKEHPTAVVVVPGGAEVALMSMADKGGQREEIKEEDEQGQHEAV